MVSVIGREAAMEANASAFSLESLGTCFSFQTRKLFKRCFTRETYFSIRGSRDSNSSLTCPTTNWESLRIKSLSADKAAANSSPARMASYSDSLLEEPESNYLLDPIPEWSSQLKTNARLELSGRPINIESPPIQIVGACFRLGEFRYEIN